MDTKTVTLIIRYKPLEGAWKRSAVVVGANGRIKPGHALIEGVPTPVSPYQYQVRYYVDRKAKFEPAGTNVSEAEALRRRIEVQASATAVAEKAGLEVVVPPERKRLRETATEYIGRAESGNRLEAADQARNVSDEFIALMVKRKKTYVDEITADDIYAYHNILRKRGCEDRTVANKHARLKSWLLFAGVDKDAVSKELTPSYEEELPTIYNRAQISSLLGAADPYKRLVILLAHKCGLRDQELMYLAYWDIDFERRVLHVRGKKFTDVYSAAEAARIVANLEQKSKRSGKKVETVWAFRVKDKEQREVPIPDDVTTELKARMASHSKDVLVLATKNGRPNTKLLNGLKVLARKAKLNCGRCEGCRSKHRECQEFTLHKFRRTYMTTLLRNRIDLKTVQTLAGHSDMESTLRYLRPADNEELHATLNNINW